MGRSTIPLERNSSSEVNALVVFFVINSEIIDSVTYEMVRDENGDIILNNNIMLQNRTSK